MVVYNKKIKIAFMGKPAIGGNYSHYSYLKENLIEYDFTLLSVGYIKNKNLLPEISFVSLGEYLENNNNNNQILAKLLLDHLVKNNFDILIPMDSGIAISIIPFLPATIQIVNIVNSNTPRVYKAAIEYLSYVAKIICISPRQIEDLKNKVRLDKMTLIPHGVKPVQYPFVKNYDKPLQIGFLGRLNNGDKGIFYIPHILFDVNFKYDFHIIGDGPDRNSFLNRLKDKNISCFYHGSMTSDEIDNIIKNWDVILFPSLVEGFGLVLIEAMRLGVVPLANKLSGITDYIIEHDKNGFIIENNDVNTYHNYLNLLFEDRELLHKMKEEAKLRVDTAFNIDKVLDRYRNVFQEAVLYRKSQPQDFSDWKMYVEYKPSIFNRIKNRINKLFNFKYY